MHAPRSTGTIRAALAAAVAGAAALAGCAPQLTVPTAHTDPLQRFYAQKLTWTACGELQCARLTVPMDYTHPGNGKTFSLPLAKAAATHPSARIGSLVFDPGGPGASGVATLKAGGTDSFSATVRARFDIVGFDPRGVAGSRPSVDCGDSGPAATPTGDPATAPDPATDAAPLVPRTAADRGAAVASADAGTAACLAHSGDLLRHVGTEDAARDLDVLRAALGDPKLSYLGWSYGTYLGTVYGELFPQRVRALVLDGAVDPSKDWAARDLEQGAAFAHAVDAYADRCATVVTTGCPAGGDPAGIRRVLADLATRTATDPLPVQGGKQPPLDAVTFNSALTTAMYTPEAQWQELSDGLRAAAEQGDGTGLATLARSGTNLQDDGSSPSPGAATPSQDEQAPDNSTAALTAVDCLDVPHPRAPDAYWRLLDRATASSGDYGATTVLSDLACRTWPAGTAEPHRVHAPGLPPVLVVGTTGDPATPYQDAQSLAAQLPHGMLLTYDGLGHTAYGRSNGCVTDAVDGFLVDLRPVADGTTC
ncbi:alpha/beta hydrolase [Streptacidiphilus jiangxiensis]|uniref:TAP-like protein n=1 Tax=Streptacidiphilus jiangxiensis TaxID=235985 RepID=A0A1H7TSE3_STRJI|nr:alpha/beta hydrolase [Streptacidiphilus jiangxiensis]SEL87364.1 TAP-like protein [Streptacidiphilus jiangxiensis]